MPTKSSRDIGAEKKKNFENSPIKVRMRDRLIKLFIFKNLIICVNKMSKELQMYASKILHQKTMVTAN